MPDLPRHVVSTAERDAVTGIRQVDRAPIPFSRLQRLLRDLLGQDDLRDVGGVVVQSGSIVIELRARDDRGQPYVGGRDENGNAHLAVDRIHIRVDREDPAQEAVRRG